MANRFSIQPASGLGGFQALSAGLAKRGEFELQKAAEAKDLQKRQEGTEILQSGDVDRIQAFMLENPDIAADVDKAYQFKNQVTEDNAIKTAWDIYTGKKEASQALIERADVVLAEGGDASGTLQLAEQAQQDPSVAKNEAALLLMRKDPAAWKLYQESIDAGETPDAGASTDLSRYANLVEEQYALDNPGKTIPPKLKAAAMMKLKRASPDEVSKTTIAKLLAKIEYEPKLEEKKKFAAMTGSSRAQAIDKGFEKVLNLSQNLDNLDRAIAAVNAGAGTGAITRRFPSIRESSVMLDQVQGQLALDVIGSVTFGALSKGELDLAKAVAIPTGLEGPALVEWLQDKKSAQTKLIEYFKEQIQFLDGGGTVAGFLRKKEAASANGGADGGQQFTEGQTATGPSGMKMIFNNGNWEAL